jgi:phospho-N-acetylmuramoyl-pentapeptide-transferase
LIDDWSKARGTGGILARQKLVGQIILAVAFLLLFAWYVKNFPENVNLPELFGSPIWWGGLLLIIGTSNAVNLTDGIDGLATGLSLQCALVFAFLLSSDGTGSTFAVLLWSSLGGACLGFLAFNKNPAKVFMGDTGSLALGAAVGAGAILTRSVWLLPFIGFIFFVEMFSVIFQVAYFKYTKKKFGEGRRIFRRAPLHHHFELGGWKEWRVVGTFWAVNALTTVVGLILWKAGVIPRFP